MAWLRRKQPEVPAIPTAETLERAVEMVKNGTPKVRVGSLHVAGGEEGAWAVWSIDKAGGIELAIRLLNTVKKLVSLRYTVQLHVSAEVQKSFVLPGGIQRLTHPGYKQVYASFGRELEIRAWLRTPEGRSTAHSHTCHWYVQASPRRWL